MGKPGDRGLTRIVRAFGYSMQGFRAAWRHESAFRQEVALAPLMVPGAWFLGRDAPETALLLATLAAVVVVELLNSAIEAAIDRIGDEDHKLSGRAKDLGSAAVLVALGVVILVWGGVAWDRYG